MKTLFSLFLLTFLTITIVFSQESSEKIQLIGSLNLGSTGIGGEVKLPIKRHTVKLGYNYLPLSYSTDFTMGLALKVDAEGSFKKINCTYEYQLFEKKEWFKVQAGISYLTSANSTVTLTPTQSVSAGIVSLNADEIGNVTVTSDSKGIAPYLGLGFGRTVPKKKLNVGLDLGVNYINAPKVTSIGTKLLSDNEQLGIDLTEKLKTYRWLPVMQLSINYLIEFKNKSTKE